MEKPQRHKDHKEFNSNKNLCDLCVFVVFLLCPQEKLTELPGNFVSCRRQMPKDLLSRLYLLTGEF